MGGFEFDDHGAIMGDWMPPTSSPGSVFSSMLGNDVSSRSDNDPPNGNQSGFSFPGPLENRVSAVSNQKEGSRGGLVERMAARAGFNAPRLDTESIRPADVQSPYLMIPPGLSPTTLLESPVFLSNSMAQPSPTTGKFGFFQSDGGQSTTLAEFSENGNDNFYESLNSAPFTFKTFADSERPFQFNASNGVNLSNLPHQSFPGTEVSSLTENRFPNHSMDPPRNALVNQQQADYSRPIAPSESDHSPPLDDLPEDDADQRVVSVDPTIDGAPTEDGYNWRKYGQKQVKGSEFPRSYFKCTHPNCPVKKKVERSQEGHITEIIYKGAHNHPKPPPNRRSVMGSSSALLESGEQAGGMGDQGWRGVHDNLEVTSSVVGGLDYSNGTITSLQAQNGSQLEHGEAVDGSSTFSNGENDEDRATQGSVSLGYDGEGDESQSKRRKVETYPADVSGATRAIREPRVVVQTTSEVDILDDGYRWRKYGQKVVKGNPNPRSYYKCTSPGCSVRKHVERASHDLKSVITTYEGKHNHDVPAARNTSHVNSVLTGNLPSQLVRPEPSQLPNSMSQFERASLGPYGIPGRPPTGPPSLGFGFGMHQAGLGMPGMRPMNQYLAQQNQVMNDMGGLMYPKGEPKSEPMSDLSNGSSVYSQVINRLPLGP